MPSWWDFAYRFGAPWDSGRPPDELKGLVEGGRLKDGKVLDIGCGTGTSVLYLAKRGFQAFGVDASRVAIRKAVAKAERQSVKCSFYLLDFTDTEAVSKALSAFDILLDVGCFHSLSTQNRERYVDSLMVVSRPNSIYLLWFFIPGSGWSYGPPGVSEEEVEGAFSKQFNVVEKHPVDTAFRPMHFYMMLRRP
ncbi:MAG: class I SAM-dependent methyltransferase [Candidatus Bathyarchaeia archaeon]